MLPMAPLPSAVSYNQIFIKKLAYILCDFSEQSMIMPDFFAARISLLRSEKVNILEKT